MMKKRVVDIVTRIIIGIQFIFLATIIIMFNPLTNKALTIFYASKYGLNKTIFYRQIKQESYFRTFVRSPKGAIGIGQVMFSTAVYIEPEIKRWELYLPWKNLNVSGKYMQFLLDRYKDNYSLALAAYNWGETNVHEKLRENNITIVTETNYIYLFQNVRETYHYIEKILR